MRSDILSQGHRPAEGSQVEVTLRRGSDGNTGADPLQPLAGTNAVFVPPALCTALALDKTIFGYFR